MIRTPLDLIQPWARLWYAAGESVLEAQARMWGGLPMQERIVSAEAGRGPAFVVLSPITCIIDRK